MDKNSKIYVAGHRGLVGSAIMKNFKEKKLHNYNRKTHSEIDLTNQAYVENHSNKKKLSMYF